METVCVNPLICEICQKEFTSVWNKKRHLLKIHNDDSAKTDIGKQHFICSICPSENKENFSSYNNSIKHSTNSHNVNIKESVLRFQSLEEFEAWRRQENREVDYVCVMTIKSKNGDTQVNYCCNRSDYRGYECVGEKSNMKSGGSIDSIEA